LRIAWKFRFVFDAAPRSWHIKANAKNGEQLAVAPQLAPVISAGVSEFEDQFHIKSKAEILTYSPSREFRERKQPRINTNKQG
jgi:hypothetical protein